MTELSFAKSFLTTLDSRPNKVSPDHIEDPRSYPARSAFILPKSHGPPFPKRQKTTEGNVSSPHSITVSLKSLRNPPFDVTLRSQDLNTSVLDLKEALSSQTNIPTKSLRLLYNKKPVVDSKILKDILGDAGAKGGKAEFSVMVIGGAAAVKKDERESEPIETGMGKGKEVLKTDEFWNDLKGFLVQRLKDDEEGERVWGVFREVIKK
ncbi:Ubiquitin-like protein [Venustampulla echinocandica]|uniref:Ubiquitin-like protein n=1 Tax=Venustampulla echinocandica TaxID=2656787 RepID=A0A370TGH9_9HELO|nr:Ubiquitin-like protein [Venustampulla echinocandica]RDL33993.1 Ubiquitin-like protein [Venustampulla echinocandica]